MLFLDGAVHRKALTLNQNINLTEDFILLSPCIFTHYSVHQQMQMVQRTPLHTTARETTR
jgi:hypothetical protein